MRGFGGACFCLPAAGCATRSSRPYRTIAYFAYSGSSTRAIIAQAVQAVLVMSA